jgi:uncharacterized membrane protein YbhN (UPF0104 family)
MTQKHKRILFVALKAIVTLGLLFLVAKEIDLREVSRVFVRVDLLSVVLAVLVITGQASAGAYRWQRLMRLKEVHVLFGHSLRFFWLGLFFNQLLPSSVGGDAVRGYCAARESHSLRGATLSVILDRVLGLVGLIVVITGASFFAFGLMQSNDVMQAVFLALLMAGAGLGAIFFLDVLLARFSGWRFLGALVDLAVDARNLFVSRNGWGLILLSCFIHVLSVFSVFVLADGLGVAVTLQALFVVVPVAMLLATIPISIAGWGIREGVMVAGLGQIGIPSEEALALSILYGLSLLVVAMPGVFFWRFRGETQFKNVSEDLMGKVDDIQP